MYIAPAIHRDEWLKLKLDDDRSTDWNRAIEVFLARIQSRYLEPIDLLISADEKRTPIERRYGFSIMAINCILVETLQSFREGLIDTEGKSKDMFKRFLPKREGFREHFQDETQAEEFYKKFRCGILHQAEIMGPWLVWSVGSLKGQEADGTPYINRTKFYELLKDEVTRYCDELRNLDNSELRKNFRTKMDFIARKTEKA